MSTKDPFYGTPAWKAQRARVLARDGYQCRHVDIFGRRCTARGAPGSGGLAVDHARLPLVAWRARGGLPEAYPDEWCETVCLRHSGERDGGRRNRRPRG